MKKQYLPHIISNLTKWPYKKIFTSFFINLVLLNSLKLYLWPLLACIISVIFAPSLHSFYFFLCFYLILFHVSIKIITSVQLRSNRIHARITANYQGDSKSGVPSAPQHHAVYKVSFETLQREFRLYLIYPSRNPLIYI